MRRTGGVLAVVLGVSAVAGAAECTSASSTRGKKLFADNCGHCHGSDAAGGGTMAADLKQQASDLTHLSADNGGTFPEKAVREVVDGRDVPEHLSEDMPAWGITFHVSVDTEAEVRQRICDLVAYVRSLQK